jgi:hypothetical protein
MKKLLTAFGSIGVCVALAMVPACQGESPFPSTPSTQRIAVTITAGDLGSPGARLPISFTAPSIFTVDVQALDANGNLDTSFSNYVMASVVPGTVVSVTGPNTNLGNILLDHGQANGVQVAVQDVYGDARIWVEDVGYVPVEPLRVPPPQCANGLDDNLNGKIDYPTDPGCYAPNDDTENDGTGAAGATDNIYFEYPRIADVRGVNNGGTTPFNNQQLAINTLWVAPNAPGGVVVTGVSSSGFYATDLTDTRGYSSVYAYNYTAPPIMLPCDRLISFGGTAGDFYGYTEINFPTWSLEEWDPSVRPCLVPPPAPLIADYMPNSLPSGSTWDSVLTNLEAALVQVAVGTIQPNPYVTASESSPNPSVTVQGDVTTTVTWTVSTTLHIAHLFGSGYVPGPPSLIAADYIPSADATDCDYNGDGKIEFDTNCGPAGNQACPEDLCATACEQDIECSEYSAFATESEFEIVVESTTTKTTTTTTGGVTSKPVVEPGSPVISSIQGIGSADATFDPQTLRGQQLGAFTGNLLYFSGGSQFTIQARCADDIVTSTSQKPLPPDKACVVERNQADQTNAN